MVGAPLADTFVVVDLTEGIAGGYCTKILIDAGADVIKVEPPTGDALRRHSSTGHPPDPAVGGPLFGFLSASKHSVVADPDASADHHLVASLVRGADAVVWREGSPWCREARWAPEALRTLNPTAVVLALTPWGYDSPFRDRPATEFTLQALSGGPFCRGRRDLPPLTIGGSHGDYVEGAVGALGALLGRYRALHTGKGDLVDVSALDAVQLTHAMFPEALWDLAGRWFRPFRTEGIPSIHRTADGWVGFWVTSGQQWLDFCAMVDRPDWVEDQQLLFMDVRAGRHDELVDVIDAWTRDRTTREIEELATAFRLPVAPIGRGDTLPEIEHFRERGFYVTNEHTGLVQPDVWYDFGASSAAPRSFGAPPRLGQHTDHYRRTPPTPLLPRPDGARTAPMPMPFEGLRIADMTAYWAGPIITHFFALFGADVIHIESTKRPDGIRSAAIIPLSQEGWWETSPFFTATNTDKRDVAIDLGSPAGHQLMLELLATCDVFVENFSPRVLGQLGLDADDVHAVRPDLIVARAPAFGITGPWRDRVGYAPTIDQASGLSWVTGVPDHRPFNGGAPSDALGGLHGAIAVLLALEHRRRTGEGMLLEIPQVRSALNVSAEQVLEHAAHGVVLERTGNRSWTHAPQGAYRVQDVARAGYPDDDWIALSVVTDEQWQALCAVLGADDLSADPALATAAGRLVHHDRIDHRVDAWARPQPGPVAVAALLAVGVPAAPMAVLHERADLDVVLARQLYEWVDQPKAGKLRVIGFPVRIDGGPDRWHRTPAPMLGQHNREVLMDLLGHSAADVDQWEADGVIGNRAEVNLGW